jgi:serine/threonine-protein kinase
MATVLRGVDLSQNGLEVAIKVMHPHLAEDRTFTARFKREAQNAALLKHPNTVGIIHFGEHERMHFLVMELCKGRDLRDILKIERRLTEVRAANIVISICDALEAAHRMGMVHRDLKPENIMVEPPKSPGEKDLVKVLDFGIAKLVDGAPKPQRTGNADGIPDSEPPPALTQVGVVVGTPAYMSPEQCRGQPLDGRSDLYTCGILLYQLVTGQVPFDSESPFEVAGKQAFEPPPPPSKFLPSIYPPLEQLILSLLAKAPADRPQTAAELRDALRQNIAGIMARGGKTIPMTASKPVIDAVLAMQAGGGQGPVPAYGGQQAPFGQGAAPGQPQPYGGFQQQAPGQQPWQQPAPQAPGAPAPQFRSGEPTPTGGRAPDGLLAPGYPTPPGPTQVDAPPPTVPHGADDQKGKRRGPGAGVKVLFILVALLMGVGSGYAAWRFLYLKGKLPFLEGAAAPSATTRVASSSEANAASIRRSVMALGSSGTGRAASRINADALTASDA